MRYLKLFLCLLVVSLTQPSMAMTPTPQQIEQFKKLPKSQQKALAKQYGIDLNQLDKSSKQVEEALQDESLLVQPRSEEEEKTEEEKFKPQMEELKPFGYELFAGEPMSFMPSENAAIPDSYIIGPGDEFQINFYGKESDSFEVEVDREGRLTIPKLSPVNVAGLKFSEVKALVKAKIEQEIIGVQAFVSMGRLRSMRILVLGEAYKPGAYSVSSLASVTHALFVSGGITEIGSLRNIQVKRAGKVVAALDLYDLLTKGDSSNDIVLQSGDVVFIPSVGKQVTVSGLVKRPAIFELKKNETADDLIRLAGGFKAEAFPQKTVIERYAGNSFKTVLTRDFSKSEISYQPHDGDVIKVQGSSEELENAVTIMGAVSHPGNYQWQKGDRISDLISSLKSDVLPIADFDYSLIVREKNIRGDIELLQFSLVKAIENQENNNIELKPRDIIIVFSRFEELAEEKRLLTDLALSEKEIAHQAKVEQWQKFENRKFSEFIGEEYIDYDLEVDDQLDNLTKLLTGQVDKLEEAEYSVFSRHKLLSPVILKLQKQASAFEDTALIAINGRVRYPGVYPLVKDSNVKLAIDAAGGLLESAYMQNAEITRVNKGNSTTVEHITVNLDEVIKAPTEAKLYSKDSVNIFATPNWSEERTVSLFGEVRFPGTYSIKRGETLELVLERAGGLTDFAAKNGAIFTRQSIRTKEKAQLQKLSDDLRREIASKSFSNSVTDASLSYEDTDKLLKDLAKVQALGRLVIDLPKIQSGAVSLELEKGDALYIPAKQSTVSVIGEVNVSTSHLYSENLRVEDYLEYSGGLKQRADEDRIYVIKANGSVYIPGESSWFAVNNSKNRLEPGDTIVVPLDAEYMNQLTLWSTATQIVYQLGLAAAAISAL
ncbi:SLBB domain-containing protein [Pseudoalteromonas piratica]|uniref:Polysaccharide biosynthesis protein n=1 Tax=Pseudoalteromonas piratica TaxID=1348114 RepID=A0A0A7ED98_9GAMM|nr:polysaccharide biosynthesis protein [Pseudoalteromonas piratica]